MYRRSYKYEITPEQREEFMKKVKEFVSVFGGCTYKNDYPYDMCRDKKVNTDHLTYFYKIIDSEFIETINLRLSEGYTVQINSSDNQTIPEIQHLHFIKIIND